MAIESKPKKFDLSNRLYVVVVILFAFCLIYLAAGMFYEWKSFDQTNYNQITVSGEGKIYASPDLATVTLGLETNGKDVKEITQKSSDAMNEMIAKIKGLGIDSADIQTTQYTVAPQYDYTDEGRKDNGYQISQNVEVKIRDFSKIGDVLSAATASGANVINDLQFSIENPEKSKAEARQKAIDQAKEKAQTLAAQSGIKLGKIINVYEDSYTDTPNLNYSVKSLGAGVASLESADSYSSQIESGQQQVSVTVSLTYKIK